MTSSGLVGSAPAQHGLQRFFWLQPGQQLPCTHAGLPEARNKVDNLFWLACQQNQAAGGPGRAQAVACVADRASGGQHVGSHDAESRKSEALRAT